MRTTAIIFSAIAFYALLCLVNVQVYQFMPLHTAGSERGLIEASLALMFGLLATLLALVFAFLHFGRNPKAKSAQALLVWCGLLIVGFAAVFAKSLLK